MELRDLREVELRPPQMFGLTKSVQEWRRRLRSSSGQW